MLREVFDQRQMALDAACAAALSGPIAFDLDASLGNALFQVTLTDSGRSQAVIVRPEPDTGD